MEAVLELSEPLVHWMASAQPLLEEFLSHWIENSDAALEAYQVEYTRLFVARWGGIPVPLYASWYLDRETFRGAAAEASANFYERWGLAWHETDLKAPPDHLALELEFLEILCRHVLDAPHETVEATLSASVLWREFRSSHFDLWVPRCAAAMGRHATLPVYKILALTLTQLCEEDKAHEGRHP